MYYVLAATAAILTGIGVWWLMTQRETSVAAAAKTRQTKAAERARFAQSAQSKADTGDGDRQNELQKQRLRVRNFGNR